MVFIANSLMVGRTCRGAPVFRSCLQAYSVAQKSQMQKQDA
jgi:hypothetical protein